MCNFMHTLVFIFTSTTTFWTLKITKHLAFLRSVWFFMVLNLNARILIYMSCTASYIPTLTSYTFFSVFYFKIKNKYIFNTFTKKNNNTYKKNINKINFKLKKNVSILFFILFVLLIASHNTFFNRILSQATIWLTASLASSISSLHYASRVHKS